MCQNVLKVVGSSWSAFRHTHIGLALGGVLLAPVVVVGFVGQFLLRGRGLGVCLQIGGPLGTGDGGRLQQDASGAILLSNHRARRDPEARPFYALCDRLHGHHGSRGKVIRWELW